MDFANPTLRDVYKQIVEHMGGRVEAIATGASLSFGEKGVFSAEATAMRYAESVAYIKAMREVLTLLEQMDKDKFTPTKKVEDGDD